MKKITFLLFFGLFILSNTHAQMSFSGNSLEKSAFNLDEKRASFTENLNSDSKILISDEENDMLKKRRKKRGRGRGRGGDYSNSIKANPIIFLFGYLGGTYERKIGDQMSLSLGLAYYSNSSGGFGSDFKYSGFNISPEFRYYFDNAIEGWYMNGTITFTSINSTYKHQAFDINGNLVDVTDEGNISVYGAGVAAGHQWIWGGFTLDVYGGAGFVAASTSGNITGGLAFGGFWPVLGTSIGYSF